MVIKFSDGKESACNTGDLGSTPGSGRSPGVGKSNPLQYSCLGNPMDTGTWQNSTSYFNIILHFCFYSLCDTQRSSTAKWLKSHPLLLFPVIRDWTKQNKAIPSTKEIFLIWVHIQTSSACQLPKSLTLYCSQMKPIKIVSWLAILTWQSWHPSSNK